MIRAFLNKFFTSKLYGEVLDVGPHMRVFCDAGHPRFHYMPRFRRMHYAKFWQLRGFALYLWGREITFSFGQDIKGLYK